MGRSVAAVWLVTLLLCSLLPNGLYTSASIEELEDSTVVSASGASNLVIAFSNGPAENDEIKGNHALTFSVAGSGTLESLLIEITTDESTWTTVVNLTTSPWLFPLDTTGYTNDTYKLEPRLGQR